MNKYITCVFGEKYSGMLLALLESIEMNSAGVAVEVYYQDMPPAFLDAIKANYPNARFHETNFAFSSDKLQRISSKTLMWSFAVNRQMEGDTLCLLDVDTLVLAPPFKFINGTGSDLVITSKDEVFRLNSGVMLVQAGARSRVFFNDWQSRTVSILQDRKLAEVAKSRLHPYGGADQMSLYQMIDFRPGQRNFNYLVDSTCVKVRAIDTRYINETNSTDITPDTHIIHYKGGWQLILLEGLRFRYPRTRDACRQMYDLYLHVFGRGLSRINRGRGRREFKASELSIVLPLWHKRRDGFLGDVLYSALWCKSLLVEAAMLLKLLCRRLRAGMPL